MKVFCDIEGCAGGLPIVRGWCTKHYSRWKKYGDPLQCAFETIRGSLEYRLSKRILFTMYCWEWTGTLDRDGYGSISIDKVNKRVHRVVYALHRGEVPKGMVMHHKCFNRACVNPMHLEPVTTEVNSQQRKGAARDSKTGIRGVAWSENHRRWKVRVGFKSKVYESSRRHLYELHIAHYDVLQLRESLYG